MLGLIPSEAPVRPPHWRELAEPGVTLIDRLGFDRSVLASRISVTPACGLAGSTPEWARRATGLAHDVAAAFGDSPDSL
jgi:hypothetical protein